MKKRVFMWLPMLLLAAVCVGFVSCGDDDDDNGGAIPTPGVVVSTISSSDIMCEEGSSEVSLSAALVPSGGKAVLTATPAVKADAGVIVIAGEYDAEHGKYVFSFSSLEPGVTYTFVITVYNSSNEIVRRSNSREVTVDENHAIAPAPDPEPEPTPGDETPIGLTTCPDENHPHAIDLGLPSGTKWACCNVGATKPEEYGLYFAWGETMGYGSDTSDGHVFDWRYYTWCSGSETSLTKYNKNSRYGIVDNKTELDLADDAAYVNWGSDWCMPSAGQIREFLNSNYTTSVWTSVNGVNGRRVTSKSNGNSLFLPAVGWRGSGGVIEVRTDGNYWSSSLNSGGSSYVACLLYFDSDSWRISGSGARSSGKSVRAVCP